MPTRSARAKIWLGEAYSSYSLRCIHPRASLPVVQRRCVRKKLLSAACREWEPISTGMLQERAFKPFPVIPSLVNLQSSVCLNPHGKQYVQIAFQLLRKLRRIMAPHFSNSYGNALSARLSSPPRTLDSALHCRFFPNTRFTFENRTNCLLLRVSLRRPPHTHTHTHTHTHSCLVRASWHAD